MAKTSFDVFSLSREQVWTFLVFGDRIYEMKSLLVVVGLNAPFIVLPHWDNMDPHANPPSHIILTQGQPPKQHSIWVPVGPQLSQVGPQLGLRWASDGPNWGRFGNAAWAVMFRGPHFIISTMQAGLTPIFKIFGMTGPSTNRESNPQNLHQEPPPRIPTGSGV